MARSAREAALTYLESKGIQCHRLLQAASGRQSVVWALECLLPENTASLYALKEFRQSYRHNSQSGVDAEYRALKTFHAALSDRGGPVSCPEPLEVFSDPPAYLMRFVAGESLDDFILATPAWDDVIEGLLSGLSVFHESVGAPFEDCQLRNILVEGRKEVIFIDPTLPNPVHALIREELECSPLEADLGYWVYSVVGQTPRLSLAQRRLADRRFAFTAKLLVRAALLNSRGPNRDVIDAVERVAVRHLRRMGRKRPTVVRWTHSSVSHASLGRLLQRVRQALA
jgi:hypothetical protein